MFNRVTILASLSVLIFCTASFEVRSQGGAPEAGGPARFDCIAYQHRDFKGATMKAFRGRGWKYVGSNWNDKISSFQIRPGCYAKVWQHRDYRGDSRVFNQSYRYIGDLWNDNISSWMCYC